MVALVPRPAFPQRITPTLDIGGARIRYADSLNASVLSLSPSLRAVWARASVGAVGTYSRFGDGGWSADGDLDLSVFSPNLGSFLAELAASGGGTAQGDGTRTGRVVSTGRAHAMAASAGAWAGGGLGRSYDGDVSRPIRLLDFGAWGRMAGFTLVGNVEPSTVDDTIRYTDANLALRHQGRRVEVGLSGGLRTGDRLPALGGTARSWGTASIVVRLTDLIAVVVAGGAYPVDLTQGFPGGRFASLGVRVGRREPRDGAGARSEVSDETSALDGVTAFALDRSDDERHTVRVHAPAAKLVELSGDFTAWKAVPLTSSGNGWWTTTLVIAAGTHQVNLRIDGGKWIVPPGLTRLEEEFGGATGLLIVSPP